MTLSFTWGNFAKFPGSYPPECDPQILLAGTSPPLSVWCLAIPLPPTIARCSEKVQGLLIMPGNHSNVDQHASSYLCVDESSCR